MFNTFHANIEEEDINLAVVKLLKENYLRYIHFADSNRQVPGKGNINFLILMRTLKMFNYDGFIVLEAMAPGPNPFKAIKDENSLSMIKDYALRSAEYMRELKYFL